MTASNSQQLTCKLSPYVSENWIAAGRHDQPPRLVHCFGPAQADDFASVQAVMLGLGPVLHGGVPILSETWAELVDDRLVLFSRGQELMGAELLSDCAVATLRRRPEVLLVWVDVPMRDPRTELTSVGMQHVWVGVAKVRGLPADHANFYIRE